MNIQTEAEIRLLKAEAERRARAGFSRPQISRALGVPLHALARWAFEGGWRAKDIMAETEDQRLAALRARIEAQRQDDQQLESRLEEARSREAEELETKARPPTRPLTRPETQAETPAEHRSPLYPLPRPEPGDPSVWAQRDARARIPPWAPGEAYPAPEACSLFLAEDLMRQGLLAEAERALRFSRNWMAVSRQVFDKQEREDEEGRLLDQALRAQAAREAEQETTRARIADWVASGGSGGSSSNNNNTNPSVNAPESLAPAPG